MFSVWFKLAQRWVVAWLLGGLFVSAFAAEPPARLKVVTSFLPVYCVTANVVGDLAVVENLLPPGVGPHDYQFSPRDMRKLTSADVVVVNGLGLESWLERALKSSGVDKRATVVELAKGLEPRLIRAGQGPRVMEVPGQPHAHDHDHEHQHGLYDPHLWMDPRLVAAAASNLVTVLAKADPKNASAYAENATRFAERMAKLDAEIETALAPVKDRPFITFHSAFNYFVKRYGLKLVGVLEEVPEVNPSPRYLAGLLKVIRDSKVKVVFTEPQFSPKLANQIAADVKVAVGRLDTLETGEMTPLAYEKAMRNNARELVEKLK